MMATVMSSSISEKARGEPVLGADARLGKSAALRIIFSEPLMTFVYRNYLG